MGDLGKTLQTFNKTRARASDYIGIDTKDLMVLQCGNTAPVGTLVHGCDVATVLWVFRQDDKLRVGADDGFIGDLWKTIVACVTVKNVLRVRVLQQFIIEGTAACNIGLSWRTTSSSIITFGRVVPATFALIVLICC